MPPRDPDAALLPYLATFARAAECCNFTAVARDLGLTQAAVSQRVQALEKAVGRPLFLREAGRVQLTEAGRKLHELAQQILALHQTARETLTGETTPVRGELLLAASSIPGEHFLPELLARFHPRYPHVQARATVSDSAAVRLQVEQGEAHVGLVGSREDSPHLEYRFLARDHIVLVVPPGHALTQQSAVALQSLTEQPLILREEGSGLRHCLEKSLARLGASLKQFTIAAELGSNEGIKEAVLRGLGIAVLSRQAVQRELQTGLLTAVELSDVRCDRDLFMIRDRRRVLPMPARMFWRFSEGAFADHKPG